MDFQLAAVTRTGSGSGGWPILLLGIVLLVASALLFHLSPKFNDFLGKMFRPGRDDPPGRGVRTVGGPLLVGALGILSVIAGVIKLTSGH